MSQIANSVDDKSQKLQSNIATMKDYLKAAQNLMSFGNVCSYEVKDRSKKTTMLLSVGPKGVTLFDEENTFCHQFSFSVISSFRFSCSRFCMVVLDNDVVKEHRFDAKFRYCKRIMDAFISYHNFQYYCYVLKR